MKWIIIDGNEFDEDVIIDSQEELREWTEEMLKNFYEIYTEYGDPIWSLLEYIPDEELPSLISDYNYEVKIVP